MNMTSNLAGKVEKRILELCQATILKEFGLEVRKTRGSYGIADCNFTLQCAAPIAERQQALAKIPASELIKLLPMGGAPQGTPVTVNKKPFTIIKARQAKYLIEGEGRDGETKQYTARFEYCHLDTSRLTA
jgi:hypothetical protein